MSVLGVKTTSVLCKIFCVCDSILEKVHANCWFKHKKSRPAGNCCCNDIGRNKVTEIV